MSRKTEADEHLEQLWHMKEEGNDSLDSMKALMSMEFDPDVIDGLAAEGLVQVSARDDRITLTEKGTDTAQRLIRAHRLAERLLYDVLGGESESGACEFEHTITPEILDSICILLGHPRECPHGMPIPEGACCKHAANTARSSVMPVTELDTGQTARVAYVSCSSDQRIHQMDSLQIRPGAIVKLHQKYPTYVLECENAHVALDENVAHSICVWRTPQDQYPTDRDAAAPAGNGRGFGFRHRRRGKRP